MWKRLTDEPIENLEMTIRKDIEHDKLLGYPLKVITACDSQVKKKKRSVTYTTTIILWRQGNGARVYYQNETEPFNYIQIQQRLFMEVYKSVNVALKLDKFLIDYNMEVSEIHADLNSNEKHLSNASVKQCLGYIMGFNYKGIIKPYSWASSNVADKKTK